MMKILFAIQGTGNGHLSRARDVYPELCKYGEVDVLISGIQADVEVPFPVKYKKYGMSFIFGKKGGVDIWQTAKKLKLFRLIDDIQQFPIEDYDLVVNDFEPISAWACKLRHIPCVSLSHQCAVLNENAPRPEKSDWKGRVVLKYYAPVTASYGFHYKSYADNIFTPVIRKQVRDAVVTNKGHYTVYLPAYEDSVLIEHLSNFKNVNWEVFSKHNKEAYRHDNIHLRPINNDAFIESMASSSGVLCGAGFEGPAEALFLGKKVLAIPMQEQYEQQCNAAALEDLGVPVIKSLSKKYYDVIENWINSDQNINVNYPDITAKVIGKMMSEQASRSRIMQKQEELMLFT